MPPPPIVVPQRLESDRVALRPLSPDDAEAYAAAFAADPDLGRLLGVEQDPTPDDVRARVAEAESGRFVEFAITPLRDDILLGAVSVQQIAWQHRRCDLGLWVAPGARRRGVAAAAVGRVLHWVFDDLGMERVEMNTTDDNAPLRAFATRMGFRQEGVLRARNLERGQRVDLVFFGLLREEWPTRED